jgi:hypothetical protein
MFCSPPAFRMKTTVPQKTLDKAFKMLRSRTLVAGGALCHPPPILIVALELHFQRAESECSKFLKRKKSWEKWKTVARS